MGETEPGLNGHQPDAATIQLVVKETKDLVKSLEGTGTSRVTIRSGALSIEVERTGVVVTAAPAAAGAPAAAASAGAAAPAAGLMPVLAPLVGVYYRSGSPGAKPFVEVGDTVERGQQVGIVEAMKVMNEVLSDYRGTVKELLVQNGEAVQYEQQLMLIDISGSG